MPTVLTSPPSCRSAAPDAVGGKGRALCEGGQLGPAEFGVDAGAESAVGTRYDVLGAEPVGVAGDALGDQFRVLDQVRGVRDDAGNQDLAVRQLDVLPQVVLVLVPRVGRFNQVGTGLDLEHDVHDVRERDVVGVRAVPAAPAQVVSDAVLR